MGEPTQDKREAQRERQRRYEATPAARALSRERVRRHRQKLRAVEAVEEVDDAPARIE